MYQVVLTEHALANIEKARKWHEKQLKGLGSKCVDHLFKFQSNRTTSINQSQ